LALFRELGDNIGTAWALGFLGVQALGSRDECVEGIGCLEEALALFRELDYKPGITQVLIGLGEVAHLAGDRERVSRAYAECRVIARDEGDKMSEAKALGNLSYVAQGEGESARAAQLLTRALTLFHELGARRYICQDFARLAGPVAAQGFPQAAARLLGASEALLETMGLGLQPGDRRHIGRYVATVREHLDQATFDAAWAEGQAMSLERAFSYALEVGQRGAAAARDMDTTLVEWLDALGATGTDSLDRPMPCEEIRSEAPAAPAPPRPTVSIPPPQLPAALVPFVGRERELGQLSELLADPACRLLTLVGPGGSGKSRLAVEAASGLTDHFAHGVHFVPLAPVESVDAIVATIAQALGFPFAPAEGSAQAEPQQQLLDYLHGKHVLLLIDNFEHLLEGAGVITDILRSAPDVKVLATSRARLNVWGEHLFTLRGMHYPVVAVDAAAEGPELQNVAQYSAITLFMQGARQLRPDFEATTDDLRDIARVCQLVQGMPLGILLAAAWTEVLAPRKIAAEIEKSLDFLELGWRAVPERQRSLRAVFDHSWTLLTDREREAFQALSVFRGGFTREAAEQIGASLRDLRGLVSKSFLQQATPAGRYEVHELLRQYATEKLAASPAAQAAARDRHSAHYTGALARFAVDLQGPRQRAAMAEIEADSDNVRTAWNRAVEQEQIDRLDRAMEGLARFYRRRGRYQEGEAAFGGAADRLTAGAHPSSPGPGDTAHMGDRLRVLARALVWQAYFNRALGRRELATRLRRQSLALLQRPELADRDTRAERALLTQHMGRAVFLSDYEQARHLLEQSLALYRTLDDRWRTAAALYSLGTAALFRGAYVDSRCALEESLKIFQALGDQEGTAWTMADLTAVATQQGRFEEAERLARESRTITQALGDREGIGIGLLALGRSVGYLGEFAKARSVLEECLRVFDDLGRPGWIIPARAYLGRVNLHLGHYKDARADAVSSLELAREAGLRFRVGRARVLLGRVAAAEEAYSEAQRVLHQGLAVHREIGARAGVGWANAVLTYAARGLGQPNQMRRYLREALEKAEETGSIPLLLSVLPAAALLLADGGAGERAVELYALACRYGLVAQSRWFEDVAGRRIAAVAASLPAEVVAAAEKRGRARQLEATPGELLSELKQAEQGADLHDNVT
jgi:predicted ATPase